LKKVIRFIIDVVELATGLMILFLILTPKVQAIADGANASFYFAEYGAPFKWATSIDVTDTEIYNMFGLKNGIFIDWKWFVVDYVIFSVIALAVIGLIFLIKYAVKRKRNRGKV
jgi:hypothetical protein